VLDRNSVSMIVGGYLAQWLSGCLFVIGQRYRWLSFDIVQRLSNEQRATVDSYVKTRYCPRVRRVH
jgi:hypothetical protein